MTGPAVVARLRDVVGGWGGLAGAWGEWLGGLFEGLLETAFPPRCTACGALLDGGDAHAREIDARAARSGEGLDGESIAGAFCPPCAESLVRAADATGAAFAYGGQLAVAIDRLKYGRQEWIAGPLGRLLGAHLPAVGALELYDAVVPVPLHPARQARRGFNQAAALARALGRPLATALVGRVRDTPAQVGLGRAERQANVAGAFAVRHPARAAGRRLLLVDDVRTTGATLAECTRALRGAGVSEVGALTLAAAE